MCAASVQNAVEGLRSARLVERWLEDSRFVRIAVVVLRIHVCVGHLLFVEARGKQEGVETRQCGRLGDRTFIGRLGCRARPAAGGWEPWPFGGAACAAGQRFGRQTSREAEYCRRDARRERESASGSLAKCFTREIPYKLSVCFALCVTRMRSLRPFRRGSPNGQPLESAPRCLSRGTRRAFSFAEAARTLRLDGRLFRAPPSQTPSRERFARCNASRLHELSTALTPSNKEGRTERRLLREPDGHGVVVSVHARARRRGSVLEDAVLCDRRSRSLSMTAVHVCCFVCQASHWDCLEDHVCDGTVDRGRGQLRSDATAYLPLGVFHCAEHTKEADCHWKGMACCCVLVGIVYAVPF